MHAVYLWFYTFVYSLMYSRARLFISGISEVLHSVEADAVDGLVAAGEIGAAIGLQARNGPRPLLAWRARLVGAIRV